jgi:hypothetical protein
MGLKLNAEMAYNATVSVNYIFINHCSVWLVDQKLLYEKDCGSSHRKMEILDPEDHFSNSSN